MLITAEWFDLVFRGIRKSEMPILKPLGSTYKTLCVRLCDGFYFPISYSTLRARFAGDAKQCEQRCPGRSRLFVHRNPGEDVDKMVALDGRPYSSLPTAFLHRTQYVKDCTCGGDFLGRKTRWPGTVPTLQPPSARLPARRQRPSLSGTPLKD
jgi:hypothetical protein